MCKVYEIRGNYDGSRISFGELYVYDNGQATVYDDFWGGAERYFGDRPEERPAINDAIWYIGTRIVEKFDLVLVAEVPETPEFLLTD